MNTAATSSLQQPIVQNSTFSDVADWICESAVFAWRFIWDPHTLGTPFVCSPFVAYEISKYISPEATTPPCQYLEVGAGTGMMTRYLIQKLRPIDTLHVVEIDETLCDILRAKYGNISNVFIYHMAIQDWTPPTTKKLDAIVSTVPLNSLPSSEVLTSIFDTYVRLIKPDGTLSSVEYVGTSTLSRLLYFGAAKMNLDAILAVKDAFFAKYSFERPIVLANIPPARVTHCKISSSADSKC